MLEKELLLKAYRLMCTERAMFAIYDANRQITHYVHATARGHEAIQIAAGLQLKPHDYGGFYYRDDAFLLAMGFTPYELMLQLLAKRDDPFSGGRSYYAHPSSNDPRFPTIPHQSSATGMQAIPTTGMAHGLKYLEGRNLLKAGEKPVVLCSLGDGCITEGEVSEAFQQAVLNDLPVLYLVQDNEWGISVTSDEMAAMDAYEFAAGFKGMHRMKVDGTEFSESYEAMFKAINYVRNERKPLLLHATCPLLGHHTSGVRMEFYRDNADLDLHRQRDPIPRMEAYLKNKHEITDDDLAEINEEAIKLVARDFERAKAEPDPEPESLMHHVYAPTSITEEKGERSPAGAEKTIMVDAALHAIDELMRDDERCILYGQDVGKRLGGVFREAATLGQKYGDDRVFNTPIQEAYIIGSTGGMAAVGIKPIVEVQFCDYIFTGLNQLITEMSKSCYLTMGKFPVGSIIRVPIGAYGGGGPYHSGCHESVITPVKGIKIAYPSNAADMKGLLKAAYHDPNPVVMLEHKGLYWSKVPGTEAAKSPEPDEDYIIPFGKARIFQEAGQQRIDNGESIVIVTYGMGVHWALNASKNYPGQIEILDLRTLVPCDDEAVYEAVRRHNKCLVLTEETLNNSFAQALACRIQENCFTELDAPVMTMGAIDLPAVPLNVAMEKLMLPSAEKVAKKIEELLGW
ncbi:MAG: thiamine pyrophosphate-dependent enzyme [Bacteroidia bacterium]